jgi:hypothetical protein
MVDDGGIFDVVTLLKASLFLLSSYCSAAFLYLGLVDRMMDAL